MQHLFLRFFGDGVVDVRLAAVETADAHGIVRLQQIGFIFRQFVHAVKYAVFWCFAHFWRIFMIKVCGDAPVAAVVAVVAVLDIEGIGTQFVCTAGDGVDGFIDGIEAAGNRDAIKRLQRRCFLRS